MGILPHLVHVGGAGESRNYNNHKDTINYEFKFISWHMVHVIYPKFHQDSDFSIYI
jgi:hypothetical protein